MNCFFPRIFKKGTYKKVRFFLLSALAALLIVLFSSCKLARSAVAAPFKAIGWGATKVGEVVSGNKKDAGPKIYKLNPDGTLTVKNNKESPSVSPLEKGSESGSNALWWVILLLVTVLIARLSIKNYIEKNTKK
tara:strand:- start:198 stop:599 length:402 start_codon:yes stop_codon:yes gene_type:complete